MLVLLIMPCLFNVADRASGCEVCKQANARYKNKKAPGWNPGALAYFLKIGLA